MQAFRQRAASFYAFLGAVPLSYLGYSVSRPGENGEPSSLSQWLNGFEHLSSTWEERNDVRTHAIEQAAHDKHLFLNAGKSGYVDLKMPELINSGSPISVPAGHYANLDHVTEHYRRKYAEEEERKAKKLLQKREQAQAEAQAQT
ncbi:hypothetical protein SLS62_002728 [Diatrype stigma]|uniref:Uncharacterized protein n=1 Tax=Diatrype stigma TaxID=117547 RepID=A0AAN9YQH5_9PEZI